MTFYSDRFVTYYMDIAERTALMSKAIRLKVGCVIVKDNGIISTGYNGLPAGIIDDVCEYTDENGQLVTKPECIHAEDNALKRIKERKLYAFGADLFITHSACEHCASKLIEVGIRSVYYRNEFRSTDGIVLLQSKGIEVIKV